MFRIILALFMILVVGGGAVSASMQSAVPPDQKHIVEIQAFSFVPQRTVVSPGDTIVWINRDIVPHTVTAEEGTWPPRRLEEGQSWEVVIEDGGTYPYFCEFHPHMKGLVATR